VFTGIVEELGEIVSIEALSDSLRMRVRGPLVTSDAQHGDSIAVNGVCLTVVDVVGNDESRCFTADIMAESLQRSSLGVLGVGSPVNLERAAALNSRLGGHIVQGHIDGTGSIALLAPGEKWLQMDIQFPKELMKYVVPQGSICLDGVSLTVGSVADDLNQITVWLIPETLAKTNLSAKKPGDLVNIEVDVLAKYVERLTKRDN
jgi:riboflavin synthase